jgi:hypothetical protein
MTLRSLTPLLLIGTSVGLIYQFGLMLFFGKYYIFESNKLILAIEILTLLATTGVGIVGLIRETK